MMSEIRKYFDIRELVCKDVYNRFGDKAWQFLDPALCEVIVWLRTEVLKVPLTCNDWHKGGQYSQRGLRCNLCQLVKAKKCPYLSAHCLGKAVDLQSAKMTAAEMRRLVMLNRETLPHGVRIEDGVTWLHIDVLNPMDKSVVFFKD